MIPTDFSVLLLAWDDADPGVAVLGGAALPPTLPLVYQLASQHPVLALYPHLPASEATAALEASAPGGATNEAGAAAGSVVTGSTEASAAAGPLGAVVDGPDVHLLPPATPDGRGGLVPTASRLVGLSELASSTNPASATTPPTSPGQNPASPLTPTGATNAPATRSQWPSAGPPAAAWQAPAAPYAGAERRTATTAAPASATARVAFPPPPPRPTAATPASPAASPVVEAAGSAVPAAPAVSATAATTFALARPAASAATPAPGLPSETVVPAAFDEPVEEIGAAEARDLDAPEDDLVPDAIPPAPAAAPATEAAAPEAATAWAVRQPTLDGLNYRMIQYARRAAQLVAGRHDFGVIYAPAWPAWLAALEIRNRSGRPLVLYVPALASATAPTADSGWLLGLERMVLRRATLVLVPDANILHQLRATHPDVPGEIRIVPAADEAAVQLVLAELALN